MEREEAVNKIRELVGKDLRSLADAYGITVFREGRKNKGWAGHVIERFLGLPLSSAQAPNFGTWELKMCSLKYLRDGSLTIKETMAITMIDPYNVANTQFENSHLLTKLRKAVIAARIWISQQEESSILHSVVTFDLGNSEVYNQIREDYNVARNAIISGGLDGLKSEMGKYIQPRTKGPGHKPKKTRAFYARTGFLKKFVFPELYS
ncbi:MAG: MutH/Sau3AI family endonuclease [Candidatus Hodarchaeota archaeon]